MMATDPHAQISHLPALSSHRTSIFWEPEDRHAALFHAPASCADCHGLIPQSPNNALSSGRVSEPLSHPPHIELIHSLFAAVGSGECGSCLDTIPALSLTPRRCPSSVTT